jgi:N-acetylglucosamine-6-phosphate deacetylase
MGQMYGAAVRAGDGRVGERRAVRLVTLAPEVEGMMDAIPALKEDGVIVSIGHRYGVYMQ